MHKQYQTILGERLAYLSELEQLGCKSEIVTW